MIERIKNFFAPKDNASDFSRMTEDKLRIATAVIFLEVAHADDEFSSEEETKIIQLLKELFSIDDETVQELILISEEIRMNSVELWQFTTVINEHFNEEEKVRIIENIWKIIYTDGRLDKYEDQLVHKVARVLNITHDRLIEAKLKNLPREDLH